MNNQERMSANLSPTEEYAEAVAHLRDCWVAACGGLEVPFAHSCRTYLYVYNPATGEHGYLDLSTDIVSESAPFNV